MKKYSLGVAALLGLFLMNDASASSYEDIFRALRGNPEVRQLAKKAIKDARAFVSANPAERATSEIPQRIERLQDSDKARRKVDRLAWKIGKNFRYAEGEIENDDLMHFREILDTNPKDVVLNWQWYNYGTRYYPGDSSHKCKVQDIFFEALESGKLTNIETYTAIGYGAHYGAINELNGLLRNLREGRLNKLKKVRLTEYYCHPDLVRPLVELAKELKARSGSSEAVVEITFEAHSSYSPLNFRQQIDNEMRNYTGPRPLIRIIG